MSVGNDVVQQLQNSGLLHWLHNVPASLITLALGSSLDPPRYLIIILRALKMLATVQRVYHVASA